MRVPAVLDEPVVHPVLCCAVTYNHHCMVQRVGAASRNVCSTSYLPQATPTKCITQMQSSSMYMNEFTAKVIIEGRRVLRSEAAPRNAIVTLTQKELLSYIRMMPLW